jgi:UDP-N-acetylmuramyl pentapeptide phosphotransferase/UDP-N-acetylglucosamine-1-phosphate transferase
MQVLPAPALTFIAALVASVALVGLVRQYALRRDVLDHPGERSSHSTPTPRGGGAGLLAAWLLVLVPSLSPGWHGSWPLLVSFAGVLAVAAIGWIDDHGGLAVRLRLVAHGVAACALLPLVLLPEAVPAWPVPVAAAWWIFCAIAAANVVNFIDGIDGLIGLTALVFGGFAAVVGLPAGAAAGCGLALAGAAAGFLVWNWSPAKIFLGDVGSGAIGFVIVIIGVLLMRETGRGIILTFLPLWPIVADASATLIRRWRRSEPLTQAHRSHLYQRLANEGWGHARVSLLYGFGALAGAACSAMPAGIGRTIVAAGYLIATVGLGVALERRLTKPGAREVTAGTPSP